MRKNNYPGIKTYTKKEDYKNSVYTHWQFEELLTHAPILQRNKENFPKVLADLQANILLHHNREFTCCLFFSVRPDKTKGDNYNVNQALKWIKKYSDNLTSAEKQFEQKKEEEEEKEKSRKKRRKQPEEKIRKPVFCFYLTRKGYKKLGLEHLLPEDPGNSFENGIQDKLSFLFDKPGQLTDVHFMVLLASDQENFSDLPDIKGLQETVEASRNPLGILDWAEITVQKGRLRREEFIYGGKKKRVVTEWFGYKDGISQPVFFPDQWGGKHYREQELSPLSVVLVRDRGGETLFSAGSYMSYLKIEQNVQAYDDLLVFVAAYLTLSKAEFVVSGKTISRVVNKHRINTAIRLVKEAKALKAWAKEVFPVNVADAISKKAIVDAISKTNIGRLAFIGLKRGEIIAETIKYINNKDPDSSVKQLTGQYNKAFDVLKDQLEIARVKDEVVDGMADRLILDAGLNEAGWKERIKFLLSSSFKLDEGEKKKLSDHSGTLKLITEPELKNIIKANVKLAEAFLMGRFRNGAPVTLCCHTDRSLERHLENDFNYHQIHAANGTPGSSDDLGTKCPFSAHVRKANPRQDHETRLIARRGVTYDDRQNETTSIPKQDVGILFMAFQSSLAGQFEYIVRNWINQVRTGSQLTGVDILAGNSKNRGSSDWFLPVSWGADDQTQLVPLPAGKINLCVSYKEGDYFFAPSLSFVRRIRRYSSIKETAPTAGSPEER